MSRTGDIAAFCYSSVSLGDDIQSLAVDSVVGGVDLWVDRDHPFLPLTAEAHRLVCQGWLTGNTPFWPPDPRLKPAFVSLHLAYGPQLMDDWRRGGRKPWFAQDRMLSWWRAGEPIGARDQDTATILADLGISSYVSSCITLTLRREEFAGDGGPNGHIVVIDAPPAIAKAVRSRTNRKVIETTHKVTHPLPREKRFAVVRELLSLYANAHLVITPLLHGALPSLALGTPVVLLKQGTAEADSRIGDFYSLTNAQTQSEFMNAMSDSGLLDNPPLPATAHQALAEALRAQLRTRIDEVDLTGSPSVAASILSRIRAEGRQANVRTRTLLAPYKAKIAASAS